MRALIVYGTTEGQTHKIAERIAARIRELGHEAQLHDSCALLDSLQIGALEILVQGAIPGFGYAAVLPAPLHWLFLISQELTAAP